MKMNKKIIVSALALAMGATLAGSISGTVAWYQYSTRAQAAFIGTSVGASENLEIKVGSSAWMDELSSTVVGGQIKTGYSDDEIEPISTGNHLLASDAVLPDADDFYYRPVKGVAGYDDDGDAEVEGWQPEDCQDKMVQFDLYLRYKKGEASDSYLAKQLNLIDLTIKDSSGQDLYKAIRVHFAIDPAGSPSYKLFARDSLTNNSANANVETVMGGKLDMGNKGSYDQTEGYEWDDRSDVMYGDNTKTQTAINAAKSGLFTTGVNLGNLPADDPNGLKITVTIWIEGWQKLASIPEGNADTGTSAIWNPNTYVNKEFKVGMRFEAKEIA